MIIDSNAPFQRTLSFLSSFFLIGDAETHLLIVFNYFFTINKMLMSSKRNGLYNKLVHFSSFSCHKHNLIKVNSISV